MHCALKHVDAFTIGEHRTSSVPSVTFIIVLLVLSVCWSPFQVVLLSFWYFEWLLIGNWLQSLLIELLEHDICSISVSDIKTSIMAEHRHFFPILVFSRVLAAPLT